MYNKMISLPEIASQLVDKTLLRVDEDNVRTLLLVGSKGVGKSTLLNSILDKTEAPRETLVLEYSFGRRSNQKQGIEKTICHIWEYGGKIETLRNVLPSIPVSRKYYYCIMVDLSKIKRLWETIEICLQTMKDIYSEQTIYSESEQLPEVIIIGGKYDIFKNYESEIKKFICTTIRSLAILYNAHVFFYSSNDVSLARRAREILQNSGFGNGVSIKEKNTNFMKPIAYPRGSDSWESIGISSMTLDQLKVKHLTRIPPEPLIANTITNSTVQKTSHPEPTLDKLAASKYGELRNLESLEVPLNDYLFSVNK